MKEFLEKCLDDLDTFAGIRQLYWLMEECKKTCQDPQGEYNRKKSNLVTGMLWACHDYPMIPDHEKQKHIRAMMAKDADYDGLNSRTIHKWLTQIRHRHVKTQSDFEAGRISEEEYKPISAETQSMIDQFIQQLQGNFKPALTQDAIEAEKRKILLEEERRKGLKAVSRGLPYQPEDPRKALISAYVVKTKGLYWFPKNFYDIEGLTVPGDSEDEAREIFMNATMIQEKENEK